MNYIGLHNHTDLDSNLRLKDSIVKVEDLLKESANLGYKGIAFTGHDGCQSHIKAIKTTRELKSKGVIPESFKTILGVELYLVDREEVEIKRANNERIDFYHLILLAKNSNGHKALTYLTSEAWTNSFHYKGLERIPVYKDYFKKIINEYKNDLVCSSACLGGELSKLAINYLRNPIEENKRKIHIFICDMLSLFGEDFYLEIQPSFNETQIEVNKFILKLSKAYGIKTVITTDTHYLRKEYQLFHHYFLQSKESSERETSEFYSTTHLMSEEEIFSYVKDYINIEEFNIILNNTIEVGNKIEEYDLKQEIRIPEATIPDFKLKHLFSLYYDKYEYIKLYSKSEYISDLYFLSLLEEGYINKKLEFNDIYLDRLNEELKTFWIISENLKQQLSGYLLLTREIIQDILWEVSYVGVSRGSASGSLCNYLLDIVQLNPIKHNLPFYRFISIDRPEFPDRI